LSILSYKASSAPIYRQSPRRRSLTSSHTGTLYSPGYSRRIWVVTPKQRWLLPSPLLTSTLRRLFLLLGNQWKSTGFVCVVVVINPSGCG